MVAAVPQPIHRGREEGAGARSWSQQAEEAGAQGRSPASQTLSGGSGGQGWRGRGPSLVGLEACPTPSAEVPPVRLTDEHYGSPSNQLNLGHLDTMAGALEAAEEQRALRHLCIRRCS